MSICANKGKSCAKVFFSSQDIVLSMQKSLFSQIAAQFIQIYVILTWYFLVFFCFGFVVVFIKSSLQMFLSEIKRKNILYVSQ